MAYLTPRKLMAQESTKTESHHNKPEEHEEKNEVFDEDIDLETALTSL